MDLVCTRCDQAKTKAQIEKCNDWLKRCAINDECNSLCSENTNSSDLTDTSDNSAMDSGFVFQNNDYKIANVIKNENEVVLPKIKKTTKNHIEKINIYKSRKVHIGDVLNVYINKASPEKHHLQSIIPSTRGNFYVIPRLNWLAQPPLEEQEYLEEPAKLVVICHSATEERLTESENILLARLIQDFHICSRKFSDIAYNFLIGSDGSVFEGRGWNVIGAHTIGFNKHSVSICFIGCFTNHKPPETALERAKALIKYGIEIGAIQKNYSLVGHRQCRTSESPGEKLFEEIITWDNWDSRIKPESPPEFVWEKAHQ